MTDSPSTSALSVTSHRADLGDIGIHYRRCGSAGRLLVLLHGWPQTGHCWRHLMEPLAERYTVIAPDLRGYGRSGTPGGGYDKRTTAADLSRLVRALGFTSADVVGHDRGARVAHRWALDRPADIDRLALLDVLPTREVMATIDRDSAAALWHWFFHLQPDLPEILISGNVEAYLRYFLERQCSRPGAIGEEAIAEYVAAFSRPESLHASLEDYRAGFREDLAADDRDAREGRVVTQPLLLLWGAQGGLGRADVTGIWSRYAERSSGAAIEDCKHFLPEEQPAEVLRHLREFLPGWV
ncbi:alpha/beta fold hydrolase [Actinomadura roseirufa]|uniref:alpha/beta fold hydrolase n=1 Tax=Actinomadura roseirufa TaxID=2094049 RepID=UPI001A95513C|nr:alpha/beta hydrolase [Actinomadura roseirufa]